MKHHLYTFGLLLAVASNVQAATVTPKITKTSVTPNSAPAGTMFKFSATLNAPLTSGNKVKIDLGKGLASMTGTKTSYSLSRAIYTTGSQTYKVGIYNAKNVLQGKVFSGNYTVSSKIIETNNAPILKFVSGDDSIEQSRDYQKVYTLQLKATDSDNNLRSITVDWKDGSKTETQTAINDIALTFTHNYEMVGKFELTATAKDSGSPNLTSTVLSKTIDVIAPPADDYSKVCNSGSLEGEENCPINPILGNQATNWACTKDNKTGLIWEVKTTDGGLRDMAKTYTNYDPNKLYGAETNTDGFVFDVNSQGLCGANDWRMPTNHELLGIIKLDASNPAIDTTYFPNTNSNYWFWSSSPYRDSFYASCHPISDGSLNGCYRSDGYSVRLVR